ncbi:MAG: hypothetical protein HYW88_01505, partial [Candidatus Sungbacteria bacterium]|nr:hypothetical protein [Candidatus Sungbacteria bacterium]
MPTSAFDQVPKTLPLIGISNMVPLPNNRIEIPVMHLPPKMFLSGSPDGVFCILAFGTRKQREVEYTYGVIAQAEQPSSPESFVGRGSIYLSCLFRCSITDIKKNIDSRGDTTSEASWTLIADEPIDEALWSGEDVRKKLGVIKKLTLQNTKAISDINKFFGQGRKDPESLKKAEKFLNEISRETAGTALDKAAFLFNWHGRTAAQEIIRNIIEHISFMRPEIQFRASLPSRTEALLDFTREPSVLLRLHALELLMEDENNALKEVIKHFAEIDMPMGGGPAAGTKDIKSRYEEKQDRIPDDVKKIIEQENARLSRMQPTSSEYTVTENYVERLVNF